MRGAWAWRYYFDRHGREPTRPMYRQRNNDGEYGFLQLSWPLRSRIRNQPGLSDGAKLTWLDMLLLCYTQEPLTEFKDGIKLAPGCMVISRQQLYRELGIPVATAKKHIKKLIDLNIVFRSDMHRTDLCMWVVSYFPFPSKKMQEGWTYATWTKWAGSVNDCTHYTLPEDCWPENADQRADYLREEGYGDPALYDDGGDDSGVF